MPGRWDTCVRHDEGSVDKFLKEYLSSPDRRHLFIGAAGFDPRSLIFPSKIYELAGARTHAIALREERGDAAAELVTSGNRHELAFREMFPTAVTIQAAIFAEDLAVVGGRKFVNELNKIDLTEFSDVFLDVSAISVGVYYPVFSLLLEKSTALGINLHLLLASNPDSDRRAVPTYSDRIDSPHGMAFDSGMLGDVRPPNEGRLWLPQLRLNTNAECSRIFDAVNPDDVCPILPFPTRDPRTADQIAMRFAAEFEAWGVDPRSVLLASDYNPLDIYRSIIRLSQARRHVFGNTHSSIIVTPMGSRATAVGMLLAAYELKLPVISSEVLSYRWEPDVLPAENRLTHLWINGPLDPVAV
ncbi:hypothetical protein [Devosia sp. Leaf64]|uniref:hypothetical protein n=1 Tax=Devosia sp. Leaf64 TaxID=1736229 RepID=UPI000715FC00|nr:hypothetical protein [Devosia sp. Leaf64]KQN75047.1 hypothetical protein ASE94_01635 [Devosia sp. Leaf64]